MAPSEDKTVSVDTIACAWQYTALVLFAGQEHCCTMQARTACDVLAIGEQASAHLSDEAEQLPG